MDKPAPSGGVSSFSNSSRWERSGEPGTAFNGLTRPARGRGRGAFRGGRGGRGGHPPKDSKPDEPHIVPAKPDNSQKPANVEPKPSGSSAISTTLSVAEKPAASSPAAKPSKLPQRRGSRTVPPPVVNTQIETPEITPSTAPHSAKSSNSNRRRRSQIGRGSANIPAKINPPAPNDNLLRPNKPRLGPVPHTAPIKDTPPHLNQKIDMRNDIDALVERVRAVAMDNRPTTPGSHIDWAGDDDDSLPDLDDWGVTTGSNGSKVDVISPIIVGTLKPLPDMFSHSIPGSPLKQAETIAEASTEITHNQQAEIPISSMAQSPTNHAMETDSESHRPPVPDSSENTRKPLHPSLPAKPATAACVTPLKLRPGATPMRNSPHGKPSARTTKYAPVGKGSNISHDNDASETVTEKHTNSADDHLKQDQKISSPKPPVVNPLAPDGPNNPVPVTTEIPLRQVDEPSDNITPGKKPIVLEGLAASMHAPKAMSDSVSAPANISSYTHPPSDSLHSDSLHGSTSTHTRSHTVGRPPFHKHGQDYVPRFSRSGHSTPRGGKAQGYHARTHSSPPAGVMPGHPRTAPSTRPVITGDAISRLARTIGKTGESTSKSQLIEPSAGN